ncbi:interleukin-6 receptor subunit alpha [Pelobates cultripes]|uniref:Interleukin-6 receptor subunit alpha n=1 Tax=Pelobates cultripes TaxID=61616 RepID=A0AAD1WWZ4_PELCU|nr:interleukin-6 receptor subunit alpha [Pelobates cultripes]
MIMGGAGWRDSWLVLLCAGILSVTDTQESLCPKPVSPNSLMVPMYSNVSLTCPGCNKTMSWKSHNRTLAPVKRVHQLLKNVRYKDVDNYTCFSKSDPVCSVQLLVKETLETPVIQCYLRHPKGRITCEWSPKERLPKWAKTTLITKIFNTITSSTTQKWPCTYNGTLNKVQCHIGKKLSQNPKLFISMCVTSLSDSRGSETESIHIKRLVQPDPPVNVTISPVRGAPRKLYVSWKTPELWTEPFYQLHYEIQYSVENSQYTSNVSATETYYMIEDAVMGRKHRVMVRAQDEFKHGLWSSWSVAAEGTPWKDDMQTLPTQDPSENDITFFTTSEDDYSTETEDEETPVKTVVRRYTLLVVGVNLGIFIILFMVITMRVQKVRWQLKLKGSKLRKLFSPFGAKGDTVKTDSILMTPCASPTTETNLIPTDHTDT